MMAIKIAMIPMTTSSSTSVNPPRRRTSMFELMYGLIGYA